MVTAVEEIEDIEDVLQTCSKRLSEAERNEVRAYQEPQGFPLRLVQ
jgi:hypothetical protein